MKQKLSERSSSLKLGIYRSVGLKKIMGRLLLVLFFGLMSVKGFAQLPTQNFESGIPAAWTKPTPVGGTTAWTTSTDGYMSSGAAFIDPSTENIGSGTTARYYLVTPQITVPANGQLRFFTKQSSLTDHGNVYEIRISTASPSDPSSFTTLLTSWTETQLNTSDPLVYEEKVVDLPVSIAPGLNVYVAFVLVNNQPGATPDADSWFIDNVSLQSAQTCDTVLPGTFSAVSVNSTSSLISWTHPSATQFEIQVVPTGQAIGATGTPTGNSYTATNLNAGSVYQVYIKTICSQSSSAWAGPYPFSTPTEGTNCDAPIIIPVTSSTYSYSSNLDLFQNPSVTYTTQGSNCLPSTVTDNYLNGDKAFFSYTPTQNGVINIKQLTLPYGEGGAGCYGNAYSGVFVYDNCTAVGVNCLGGLYTTTAGVPKYITNLSVQAGHTYIIVISSMFDSGTSICFNFELNFSTCPTPDVITYKNLLQNSVSFSWNNPLGTAASWEYAVVPSGTAAPTGAGTPTTTINDNLLSDLTAGTAYDFYVRSLCGGIPGNWSNPVKFTTQCVAFTTPYTEPFDGATSSTPTPCWTSLDLNGDDEKWRFSYDNVILSTGNAQGNNNDMFVSPMINLGTTPKRLRFKYQTSSGISRFKVVLSTTGIGPNNFTTVIMPTLSQDTDYEEVEKIINIPTNITGNVNIAWYVDMGADETAYSLILDNIIVEDKPACPDPVTLTASGITTATANLTWEAGDAETQWQVVVQPKDTGAPTGAGVLVNTNSYTATGLTHATQYEYYVRAYCSSTQQSNWVGPFYFTTLCSVFDTPFYESFNDADAGTHKSCWTINDANEDGTAWQMGVNQATIQGNRFWGTPSYDDWLISPAINVVGTKALKFNYKAAFSFMYPTPRYGVEVLMSTTDTNPESFSVVMPLIEFTNIEYLEKIVYINANGPVYIAFRVPPTFSTTGGTSILNLDDVRIVDAPACPDPSALTAFGITKNTAKLSWLKGYQETQWEVKVQPTGTGVPTAAGTLTTNNTDYPAVSLLPNTTYEYYVRAFCSTAEQSAWVGPFTFTTLCESFTTPFTETFNTDSTSEACWRIRNGNSDSFLWNPNLTMDTYEGNQTAGMFTGSNGANNDWLISPTITVTAGQRLRYYYRVYQSDFHEDLEVKLSTTGIDVAAFTTTLYSVDFEDEPPLNNVQWKEKVINIPAGVTGDINIAWHIPEKEPYWTGYRGQLLLIDKVVIEDIPACPVPSNLTVSTITDTTTRLSWDANGSETQWDVYVQPQELNAPVGNGDDQYRYLVNTNPYTIQGLVPAQKYEYYVRAVCSGTTTSEWVGPFEFTTMCSFENLCDYTVTLSGGGSSGVGGGIDLIQNGVKVQTMEFPTSAWDEVPDPVDFQVLLCTGVEFSLFWDAVGTAPGQYPGAMVTVKDSEGNVVWSGDLGNITPRTTIFRTVSTCGIITCPQPTNLTVTATSDLTWTAGGTETQWEVSIQPVGNNTLPQSGTIVTTNSYTPQNTDFLNLQSGSHEFFVRAICGVGDASFWSGPHAFVRNDDASKAISVPVNSGDVCEQSAVMASFMGATVSAEPMSCNGANAGDVWFEFVAASKVHTIELGNFSAKHKYESGNSADVVEPKITMTLYKVVGTTLQEMACTYNNIIVAAYSTELEVGASYKVRLTLNGTMPNLSTFDVCIKTPEACTLNVPNGNFESPKAGFGGLNNFYSQNIVPGWRNNLLESDSPELFETLYIQSGLGLDGFVPYEGGQMVQLMSPNSEMPLPDPNDLVNIKGMFQDMDSSEINTFAYSFAHLSRAEGNVLQLYAGPPAGPFELLEEHLGLMTWSNYEGSYTVPAGQNVTRFIFRSKDNAIGNMLDAVSIVAKNNIITTAHTLSCTELSTTLKAEGVGAWVADENNPADVIIATPNEATTTITDFTKSGEYTFYWRTRYCEYSVVVTKVAVDVVPVVTTPITYCSNTVATPLTASEETGYTLAWYTEATGGTAETTAPTPLTSTAGTTSYYVAYVNADGCEGTRAQIDVVVTDAFVPVVAFEYETSYCEGAQNALPEKAQDFYEGGTFNSTDGLVINSVSGEVNIEASIPGSYVITYTVPADPSACNTGGLDTFTITIIESLDGLIIQECRDNDVWLTVAPLEDSYDPALVNYVWKNEAGATVGTNSADFNATQYYVDNNNPALPLKFTVTITAGTCTNDIEYTVTNIMCDIPRGISPNGDGKNDKLDLSGYSIKDITIFNRYGKKVYNYGANYTNNWHGQDNSNNELPDGTYFYIITKADGSNITGWIYINK